MATNEAAMKITVAPDLMKAYILIFNNEAAEKLTSDDINNALAEKGIVFGVNKDFLMEFLRAPLFNIPICIADGSPSVNGENGKVKYNFEIYSDKKPKILDDGKINYRELNLISNVNKGHVLCELVPPTKGIGGQTVTGKPISCMDGKTAILPKGKNTEISSDGMYLIASTDGQISLLDGRVHVQRTYEVVADVDNSTGNISFVGNVIVRGNVLSGFSIEAGGNVEVWGVVEAAYIKADGDIILRKGMAGLGKGKLISSGSIVAKYIENGIAEARADIKCEAIMHSNIKCGNILELSGQKGLLVGGICKVGREIIARTIGSHMATLTELEVGADPLLREHYTKLKEDVKTTESDLTKAHQAVVLLKKMQDSMGSLTEEKQELLTKSVNTYLYLSENIKELNEEISNIENKLKSQFTGKITINNTIYPGCKVLIGSAYLTIRDTLSYCVLYREGADIRVGSIGR